MFRRRKEPSEAVVEQEIGDPETAEDYQRRGWRSYSQGEQEPAISDFRTALTMDASLVDSQYGLALALKLKGDRTEALQTFQQVLSMLEEGAIEDTIRRDMLIRLVKVHLAQVSQTAAKEKDSSSAE